MNKILLAYDGSDAAVDALTTAATLARLTHARVGVISVVPVAPTRGGATINPWDGIDVHDEQLAEAKLLLGARGIEPELINKVGHPAEVIEAVAEQDGYDTIVLGRPEGGSLARLLRGSVAWHVVEHARATVVLTP